MRLYTPPKLKRGDKVGIISPSLGLHPIAPHRINRGIESLNQIGLEIVVAKNALKSNGYVSATIEQRVADIHEMFLNKEVKMIISSIGGNHSNQLLKHLDYKIIKSNPKFFVGYSDITVLHYALIKKCKLRTYYGPQIMTQFGEFPKINNYTLQSFVNIFIQDIESKKIEIFPSKEWTNEVLDWTKKEDLKRRRKYRKNTGFKWIKKGKSQGFLLGGAIPSINHLAGTEYWIDPTEKIFFIDIPEGSNIGFSMSISDIDSYFADLDNLGVFSSIKGLIIGRLMSMSEEDQHKFITLLKYYTKGYNYPVVMNVNVGHADPIFTLPYGETIELNSNKNTITLNYH